MDLDTKHIVTWQSSYSVGIKLVDEQHKELIKLTNKLFVSCMTGQERIRNIFLDTIHETVDYVGYHFGTEEKVMERVMYPGFRDHKQEHTNFVKEVFSKVEEFKTNKILTPITFVYYLRDWVLHHIAVCDRKMGEYLLLLRKNGDLQKITLKVKMDNSTNRLQIQ